MSSQGSDRFLLHFQLKERSRRSVTIRDVVVTTTRMGCLRERVT